MSPTLQPFLPIVLAIGVILAPIPRSLWALDANHIVATARPGCLRDLAGITVEEQGRISHLLTRPLALRRGDDEIPPPHGMNTWPRTQGRRLPRSGWGSTWMNSL